MDNKELLELFLHDKVVVIVRKLYGENLLKLAEAMCAGDVHLLELTFDQSDPECLTKTGESIKALKAKFGDKMHFGAGTVVTPEQVKAAADAGCEFIISPNVDEDVIKLTKKLGLISMPGAMTPSEIMQAHKWGADLVKLFPAGNLGLGYIKDIRAPISHVKLIATGGVKEENFADFLAAGMKGAGISGRLTDRKCIEAGDWAELTRRAATFRKIADEN